MKTTNPTRTGRGWAKFWETLLRSQGYTSGSNRTVIPT
jgi:hypothetical protein